MWAYFCVEFRELMKSRKNQMIFLILCGGGLYYSLVQAGAYDPIQKVNPNQIEARYADRQDFLDSLTLEDYNNPMVAYAATIFPEWNRLDLQRLESLKTDELKMYAKSTAAWYRYADPIYYQKMTDDLRYDTKYYHFGNYYGFFDGHYDYKREAAKYEGFSKVEAPLSIQVFEERTALQTVFRLSQSGLPLLLILAVIFLSGDIVLKDRKHSTMISGYPISPYGRFIGKLLVILTGSLLAVVALVPGFVILGIKYGFGRFSYPVPIYVNNDFNDGTFDLMTLGAYFWRFSGLLVLWLLVITMLILVLSKIFKNEVLNIGLPLCVLLAEPVYARRGIGEFGKFEWFPSTHAKIGGIITGDQNYFYVTKKLTVDQMLKGFIPLIVVLVLAGLIVYRRKGRFI